MSREKGLSLDSKGDVDEPPLEESNVDEELVVDEADTEESTPCVINIEDLPLDDVPYHLSILNDDSRTNHFEEGSPI